jgi:hypothetical protein
MKTPPPLSELLRRAVNQRIAAQEKMKTKRTDHAEIFGSIGMVQQFLYRYPFASDERVREWCRENRGHVARVCIGGTKTLRKLTE